MKIVSMPGVVVALLISAPALMSAWNSSSVDLVPVMLTFVITAVVASLGFQALQSLINGYRRSALVRAQQKRQLEHAARLEAERERRMNASH